MPNRTIKESICTSDSIDQLSWFAEVAFYRLIVNCDDYGRLDARLAILKAKLFPLKNVTFGQIERVLCELRTAGIVDLYEVDGHQYLQLRSWGQHQQVRAAKSRYPAPKSDVLSDKSGSDIICNQLISNDINCDQMISNDPDIYTLSNNSLSNNSNNNNLILEKEREKKKKRERKPPKREVVRHRYGKYSNVLLSDDELDALKAEFADYEDRIERLSEYMDSSGKTYKRHLSTIRMWARRDAERAATAGRTTSAPKKLDFVNFEQRSDVTDAYFDFGDGDDDG